MDTGVLIALGFGLAIIVLAMVLSRLFPERRRRRFGRDSHDANASHADGRATATWAGINTARGHDDGYGD